MIVVIADDHASIAYVASHLVEQALGETASKDAVVVSTATALLSHLDKVGQQDFLLLLDLTMPGEFKRLALIREVLRRAPKTRIVVYSASDEPLLVEAAFRLGVSAYVPKAAPISALQAGIKAAAEGRPYVDPSIRLDRAADHPWKSLTPAEREVVIGLAKGETLRSLSDSTGRAYKTITNHKYAAMQKLGLGVSDEISGYMLLHGLRFLLD